MVKLSEKEKDAMLWKAYCHASRHLALLQNATYVEPDKERRKHEVAALGEAIMWVIAYLEGRELRRRQRKRVVLKRRPLELF